MKLYLAAPYGARTQIRGYAAELQRVGYTVTCSWLDETHEIADGTTGAASDVPNDVVAGHALDDLRDVERADVFVLITESVALLTGGTATSGGRHVETGYFIARRGLAHVIVVGEPENIFHRATGVTVVPNWHEALLELAARIVEDRRPRAMPG